jgi:hypothetical protein
MGKLAAGPDAAASVQVSRQPRPGTKIKPLWWLFFSPTVAPRPLPTAIACLAGLWLWETRGPKAENN